MIAGDFAALPDGRLVWAFAQVTPNCSEPTVGSGPATTALSFAQLAD
ncbi:hypothetical protein [Streptomyces mirabilis]